MARIEKDGKTVYVPDGFTLEVPSGFGDSGGLGMAYDSWDDYVYVEMQVGIDNLLKEILDRALADNPVMMGRVERRLLNIERLETSRIAAKRILRKLRESSPHAVVADEA